MDYENEEFAITDYEFVEGCILMDQEGFISHNVQFCYYKWVLIPLLSGNNVKEAKEKGKEDEEDYLTHNYEWIYEEMENAENWLNAEIADNEHYFGFPDWSDWGILQV